MVLKHLTECKMLKNKDSLLLKIWNVLWPLFIYMAAQNVIYFLGTVLFGDSQYTVLYVLIAAILCIPIYLGLYRKDQEAAGETKKNIPMDNKDYLVIILSGGALALAMNNVIALTPLPIWFPGFEETNEVFYEGGMLLQILSAGMFGCIVEEVSLRGVIYGRMKRYWGKSGAMLLNALVFGLYHMNVVQTVYAFVLGLFFVWLYERYDSLWAPCIAHMSANLFVLLLSASTVFSHVLTSLVGFCLVTCISVMIFYHGMRWLKQTNPVKELKFVDKEPDTLEKLTAEYKEQDREEK